MKLLVEKLSKTHVKNAKQSPDTHSVSHSRENIRAIQRRVPVNRLQLIRTSRLGRRRLNAPSGCMILRYRATTTDISLSSLTINTQSVTAIQHT